MVEIQRATTAEFDEGLHHGPIHRAGPCTHKDGPDELVDFIGRERREIDPVKRALHAQGRKRVGQRSHRRTHNDASTLSHGQEGTDQLGRRTIKQMGVVDQQDGLLHGVRDNRSGGDGRGGEGSSHGPHESQSVEVVERGERIELRREQSCDGAIWEVAYGSAPGDAMNPPLLRPRGRRLGGQATLAAAARTGDEHTRAVDPAQTLRNALEVADPSHETRFERSRHAPRCHILAPVGRPVFPDWCVRH